MVPDEITEEFGINFISEIFVENLFYFADISKEIYFACIHIGNRFSEKK